MRLDGKRVLFLAAPQYEDLELWYPKIRLEEEGATCIVAGLGEARCAGKHGYPVTPDTHVDQVQTARFDALVIPGGYAPDLLRRSARVLFLVREVHAQAKPIAFICHAGWVPISARIVAGRRVTSVGAIRDDLENAGATWVDAPVVVDGHLISSRTPADLGPFCRAIITALEEPA